MANRLRGLFPSQTSSYAGKTVNTAEPAPGFGYGSVMTNHGVGELSAIDGVGESGSIVFGFGINAIMNNYGIGKTGLINNDGIGKTGDI